MMPWARTAGTAIGPPVAGGAAVVTPVGVQGADGPLSVGARVQTQWTRAEGGNDSWHAGRLVLASMQSFSSPSQKPWVVPHVP